MCVRMCKIHTDAHRSTNVKNILDSVKMKTMVNKNGNDHPIICKRERDGKRKE